MLRVIHAMTGRLALFGKARASSCLRVTCPKSRPHKGAEGDTVRDERGTKERGNSLLLWALGRSVSGVWGTLDD